MSKKQEIPTVKIIDQNTVRCLGCEETFYSNEYAEAMDFFDLHKLVCKGKKEREG